MINFYWNISEPCLCYLYAIDILRFVGLMNEYM